MGAGAGSKAENKTLVSFQWDRQRERAASAKALGWEGVWCV